VRDILKLGAILTIYAVTAGGALALVNIQTSPLIEANRTAAQDEARGRVLPGMAGGYELQDAESELPYWIGYRDAAKSEVGGYIFIAYGPGYSSTVETMIGVGTDGKIVGAVVLFQQETPGLGAKVEEVRHGEDEPWFTRQYIGMSRSDNIAVTKDGGTIDSITGATISSRAVTNSIRRGLELLQEKTGAGA